MDSKTLRRLAAASFMAWIGCMPQGARAEPSEAAPSEEVVFVTRTRWPVDAQLETTVYRPNTPPPWPLVVVNHGSQGLENPHGQPRNRPVETARFFLARGYLVAAPMRQGFSKSTGVYSWNCDHAAYAERYAGDIAAVIDHFVAKGEARADQVLVIGQSNGGLVTLGYGAGQPVARAIVNFSGGTNSTRPGCNWQARMVDAGRSLGARTHIPSLWIYAKDDPLFPPEVSVPFFEAYARGNPQSSMKLYEHGGHSLSTSASAVRSWGPDVERFLDQIGLPSAAPAGPR